VDAAHTSKLVAAWADGAVIAASSYAGIVGAPAIFDHTIFPELGALRGEAGAASIVRGWAAGGARLVVIPCPQATADVDTPADLERLEG
jgi:CTP:molybdopterin cytidylyltransferase MocA